MKPKTEKQLQAQIDQFNGACPVGNTVNLKLDSGKVIEVTITNKASILDRHTAVIWVKEFKGCYLLDRVKIRKPKLTYALK